MTKKIVSILLVLALAVFFFAVSALAANGPVSGNFSDFPFFGLSISTLSSYSNYLKPIGGVVTYRASAVAYIVVLPSSLSYSSSVSFSPQFFDGRTSYPSFPLSSDYGIGFYNASGVFISSLSVSDAGFVSGSSSPVTVSIPSGTRFIYLRFFTNSTVYQLFTDYASFSDFYYDDVVVEGGGSGGGSGSGYDPSLDQDILSGVEAIAQSLLDLETGPYTTTSGVSLNSNGVVTPTTVQQATLEQLLSLIGASSTYSGLVLEQMNLNFGNYFEYYETSDSTSGTVTVVRNLPAYVNAVGGELTDGINKLQRDNLLLYQQGEDIEDALYTDKTDNQPWSVAQWLKDIYTSITSFFSSFWSPAETDLKTASEDGMQAAADNGNVASASQVDEVNSAADAFKSFGSTGNIGSGDVMDIFSDGASYDFFSQTTKDNLAYHPPSGGQRMLRSSSAPLQSDQSEEEYVDELDDKLIYWREVLGLP